MSTSTTPSDPGLTASFGSPLLASQLSGRVGIHVLEILHRRSDVRKEPLITTGQFHLLV